MAGSSSSHLLAPVKANWWLPLALVALVPLAWWIEGGARALGVQWDPYWARIMILLGINVTLAISLQLINGIAGQFSLGHAGFMAVGAYLGGYAVEAFGKKTTADDEVLAWAHPGGALAFLLVLLAVVVAVGSVLYLVYWAVRLTGRVHRSLPGWVVWTAILYLALDVFLKAKAPTGPLGALAFLSFAAGLLSEVLAWLLSHAAPLADFVTGVTPVGLLKPLTFLIALIGGGVFAAVAGLVVGLPTLRLRGDYLAIATLGVSELIGTIITNTEPLGRSTGLSVPSYAAVAEGAMTASYIFPWVFGVALLATLVVYRIQHSPKGRALQCLREDEIAAGAVGINVTEHKVLAFVVGAALAGVAGVLFAHFDGYLNPKQFGMQRSIELVVIVTLGGLGSIRGTLVACVLLTLLQPALQTSAQWLPSWMPTAIVSMADKANQYRLVIYALLLILAMLARSKGWFGWFTRKRPASGSPVLS